MEKLLGCVAVNFFFSVCLSATTFHFYLWVFVTIMERVQFQQEQVCCGDSPGEKICV